MQAPALVILTQEAADNAQLAARLNELGISSRSYPCIETKLLPWDGRGLPDGRKLKDYAVLAFTSRRGVQGVETCRERIAAAGITIACVGSATAQEASARLGLHCSIMGEEQTALGLARAVISAYAQPASLLHARGSRSSGEFRELLEARGWTVTELIVYENQPLQPPALEAGTGSLAVFASPSAAEQFELANPGRLEQLSCVAIGAVTARRLRELGAGQVTAASEPNHEAAALAVMNLLQAAAAQEGRKR